MKAAVGLKAHSGWAALVAVGIEGGEIKILDRRRIELTEPGKLWAKQPYHAAEHQEPARARKTVQAGIVLSRRCALKEIRGVQKHLKAEGHRVTVGAVLVPSPMPPWSTAAILSVHFRMHKAEGVLFPDSLLRAAKKCGLKTLAVPEKELAERVKRVFRVKSRIITGRIAKLGKEIGPPWGSDQKSAAMAALVASHPRFK